jgi:hypothetical protein
MGSYTCYSNVSLVRGENEWKMKGGYMPKMLTKDRRGAELLWMSAKLSTTISKIPMLSNKEDAYIVSEFHRFMKENGEF